MYQETINNYVRGLEHLRTINYINRQEFLRIQDTGDDISHSLKKQCAEESLRVAIEDVANLCATMMND